MIEILEKIPAEAISPHRVITLKPYQADFIQTEKRYPAMVSGWGSGKSMCAIERARIHCERYPNNLGMIVRKEFVNLADSTIIDFEKYLGVKVDSHRNYTFPNGSKIMFRHAEELTKENLSDINLGFFEIMQGEEFDSDEVFFALSGRIRLAGVPHWGCVIANAKGHNWIYKLWKAGQDEDFDLYEATSFDNADNLPADTIADWKKLKDRKPKIYNRFVMNSWDEDDVTDNCINPDHIERALNRRSCVFPPYYRIIGVDVARKGDDKTVAYALENGIVLGKAEWEKRDTMETVGHLLLFAEKHKGISNFAVDELNAGAGVVDRLAELGKTVIAVNSARGSNYPEKYRNIRAEVWGMAADYFETGEPMLPKDDADLIEQLKWSRWKKIESNMVLQVELKEDIIKRYGRSPDNADAYLYGLWGMKQTQPVAEGYDKEFETKNKTYFVNPMWDAKTKRQRGQYDRLARV